MTNDNTVDERTLKIVELARTGIGGEKEAAQRILQRICAKQGLSYEDLINDTSEKCSEHLIVTGKLTKSEQTIAAQVMYRFATSKEHPELWTSRSRHNRALKGFIAVCTPTQAAEAQYAVDLFLRAYRAELKRIQRETNIAFVIKHRLFAQYETEGDNNEELTEEKRAELIRAQLASYNMAEVPMYKAIEQGNARQDE